MTPITTSAEVYGNYAGNKKKVVSIKVTFDDENPARRGSVLARFQASSPEDITDAVAVASDALDGALKMANESCYALWSAIFTKDLDATQKDLGEIDAGLAHVNLQTGFKLPALPFGGRKESGFGLPEYSQTGLEFFVDRKAVYINSNA
jgi:acyl-CoA reductase-like NAD-dependent aldehyde dehydrogenase